MLNDDPSEDRACGGDGRAHDLDTHDASALDPEMEPDAGATGLRIVNWSLKARRLREEIFGPGLFADPAWDILLDLFTAEAKGERVQISSLAIAAQVPHSTAIRWARILTGAGLLVREKDPSDGRRVHVSLSQHARTLMDEYLGRLSQCRQLPPEIATNASR